jgi:hypothetical protein
MIIYLNMEKKQESERTLYWDIEINMLGVCTHTFAWYPKIILLWC